jgi:hypothetical protein
MADINRIIPNNVEPTPIIAELKRIWRISEKI